MDNNSQNDEMREYNEFMFKLADKAREINQDFQKLSPNNKKQVNLALRNCITFEALMNFFNSLHGH